jgi:tRNA U34 2-thiouridine synthase MnmA/TrmU
MEKIKAIALVSGGLDSWLAAKYMKELGVDVVVVNYVIPFSDCSERSRRIAAGIGAECRIILLTDDYLEMLKSPRHGYGSHINPCIDCKILMLRKAGELMKEIGAKFLITGEVLGQRPMSQHRQALSIIEKESGMKGYILRPLCAQHLEPTVPEQEGWIPRGKLLDFSGRTRKPQMELAAKLGITDIPCVAGGCLLTDPNYAKRLDDYWKHAKDFTVNDAGLLKTGRYLRLSENAVLVVGRDEKENGAIERLAKSGDLLLMPTEEMAGPTALGRGQFDDALIELSARIVCRYCDLNGKPSADILCWTVPSIEKRLIHAGPIPETELARFRM